MFATSISPEDTVRVVKHKNLTKTFKLFHMNAHSLRLKRDDVIELLDSCNTNFDVLMFTETWYNNEEDCLDMPTFA